MNAVSSKKMSGSVSDNRKSALQNPKWAGVVAIGVAFTMAGADGPGPAANESPQDRLPSC